MTPQANDLRSVLAGLVTKWRADHRDYPEAKQDCADELEAALLHGGGGEAVDCLICGATGVDPEVAMRPVCCGRADPMGDCCGHPDVEPDPQPCRQCGGRGEVILVAQSFTTPPPQPRGEGMVLVSRVVAETAATVASEWLELFAETPGLEKYERFNYGPAVEMLRDDLRKALAAAPGAGSGSVAPARVSA